MSADILWPLIAALATALCLVYLIRSARQGKDFSKLMVRVMLVLGITPFFLFLVCLPLDLGMHALIGWLAPGIPRAPWWLELVFLLVVPLVVVTWLLRRSELWPQE